MSRSTCFVGVLTHRVVGRELRWLAYGNDQKHPQADAGTVYGTVTARPANRIVRREFCFTLEGEIFVRYQSFKSASELHAALKDKYD
eukprot:8340885-Pyramimonas_sp.AAC.2